MPSGKVAIVTGASRGIGRDVAISLAKAAASVVIVGRDMTPLQALADEIGAVTKDVLAVQGDVSSSTDVERIFESAVERFGRVDILINNAGITRDSLLMRMKDEDWDAVIGINLKGTFLCSRAAAKLMMKQRYGRIINISSVVGEMGNPGQANYCASKAGIIGLTKSNARELASRNITVNAIAPGFISTEMTDKLSEKVKDELAAQIPLGRFGSTQDISNAVIFLASEKTGYITGQVISVNGGMYM